MTEGRAAVSASSSSSSLSSSSSSVTDKASANPNGIQTPAAKYKTNPAKCKPLHYMYVHEGDAEGFTLVGTRASPLSCCASSLLGSPLRALLLGASGGQRLSKEHSTDLTPLLSCSEVIVRDPAHPYGPSKKASESARRGEHVVSPSRS